MHLHFCLDYALNLARYAELAICKHYISTSITTLCDTR
jgi:hypothetical protein